MPYFTGLFDRLGTPPKLRSSMPALRKPTADFERLGQWLQGVSLPKPPEPSPNRWGYIDITGPQQLRSAEELLEGMLQSYGKDIEEAATPAGRRKVLESAKRTLTTRPSLRTLQEPAVRWAFDVPDILPGGILFGGVTALGKEALEKAGKEAAEKGAKEAAEKGMFDIIGEGRITAKEKARLAQKRVSEETAELAAKRAEGRPMIETPIGMEIEKATSRPMEEFLQPRVEEEWPESVAAEIEDEIRSEMYGRSVVPKEVAAPNSQAWTENWPEIRAMVSFLKSKGETVDKATGLLYREHIPRGTKWFGKRLRDTGELASELGWDENRLMKELNELAETGPAKVSAAAAKPVETKVAEGVGEGAVKQWKPKKTPIKGLHYPRPGADITWMDEVFEIEPREAVTPSLITKAEQTKWVEGLEAGTPDRGRALFDLEEYSTPEDFQDLGVVLERVGLSTPRIVNKVGGKSKKAKDLLYDATTDKIYKAYNAKQEAMEYWRGALDEVRGGIEARSKDSALASQYAEKIITLDELKREAPKNWQEIKKLADWGREAFDSGLDFINKYRSEWGLDPIPKTKDYVPHIRKLTSFFGNIEKANDLSKAPRVPTHPTSRFFRFGEERLGTALYEDDLVSAINAWFDDATSHAFFIEPIVNLRGVSKIMDERGLHNAADAFRRQADILAGAKDIPTMFLESIFGAPGTRMLKEISNRIGGSWVGANVSTILLQPAGLVNAVGRVGVANTVGGLQNMMSRAGRRFALINSSVLKGRKTLPPLDPSLAKKIEIAGGVPWQSLEELTVGAAFHAGVRDGLKKGLSLEDAIKWGDEVASTTQGEFRRGLREPIMADAMGRIGLKFQSWAINTLGEIGYDIPQGIRKAAAEGKGIGKIANKELVRAIEMLIAMNVANRIYRSVGGREPFSLGGIIPDVTSPLWETFGPLFQLQDALVGEMTPLEEAKWEARVKGSVMALLGAATRSPMTQISKTARGVEAISRGGSYTRPSKTYPEGRMRFPVEGLDEQLRALLFGPWGTQAGQKYLRTDVWQKEKKPKKEEIDWLKGFER